MKAHDCEKPTEKKLMNSTSALMCYLCFVQCCLFFFYCFSIFQSRHRNQSWQLGWLRICSEKLMVVGQRIWSPALTYMCNLVFKMVLAAPGVVFTCRTRTGPHSVSLIRLGGVRCQVLGDMIFSVRRCSIKENNFVPVANRLLWYY